MSNKTFSIKAADIKRKWYVVDAEGKVLGRLAVELAKRLQGKHKPEYTPHMDTGDYIVVVNAGKVKVSGKKEDIKLYRYHTGYVGGLKETNLATMRARKPEEIIRLAVRGMLPKSKLGKAMLKKLKVFAGPEHDHAAQMPEALEL